MMALTIEQNVTIDVLNPRRNIIHVVQEDSTRVIRLTLLANNLPYNVEATETETVLKFVEFRKPDGHGGMYDTTSTGETAVQLEDSNVQNVWLIALDGQCFTFPGWTQINIRFETESGRRIHTFPIFVDVEPTASSDTESTDWGELNSIGDMKSAIGALFEASVSMEAKQALLNLLAHVAYADEHGQDYYDELETELYRTAQIVSIAAVFDQGSAVIYDTDDLDTLRQYLTVTATYEDLSTREITGYTLSGTLTAGTSTITVSYGGKTTTFDVTVATHFLYKLENYAFNNEYIDTELAIFSEDKDFTIAMDITISTNPKSGTGSQMRFAAVINADGSGYALSFGKGNATAENYAVVFMGPYASMSATGAGRLRFVYRHIKNSGNAYAISRKDTAAAVSHTINGTFTATNRNLTFGRSADTNKLPTGTISKAYVYDYAMTDAEINSFLGL